MAEIEYTYGVYGQELYAQPDAPDGHQDGYETGAEMGAGPAGATAGRGGTFGKVLNVTGALASLALVVGVGVWGYKLMVRDVSGVPVVRAVEGPMRITPETPGGRPADHQGLAVNAVAANGTAADIPDQLALAPRPIRLEDEDVPMAEATRVAASRTAEADPDVDPDAVAAFRDGSDGAIDALVSQLTDGVAPLSDAEETGDDRIVQPEPLEMGEDDSDVRLAAIDPAVLNAPGVRASVRPLRRPAGLDVTHRVSADVAAALSAAQDAMASTELDVAPDTLASGTRLAQLGAYDSPEIARTEWDRLFTRFGDYMDGKKRVIQKASSGGRTFYRLRAMGFDDLSDARRFCSALVAENADCIPVTVR